MDFVTWTGRQTLAGATRSFGSLLREADAIRMSELDHRFNAFIGEPIMLDLLDRP